MCPSCRHNLRHPSHGHNDAEVAHFNQPPAATYETITVPAAQLIDFLDQKRRADLLEKTCPMCAKIYTNGESFDDFQEHVESHFIDESDLLDASLEKNFEMVSHTVGDF